MDRRAIFFVGAAVVCLALMPFLPHEPGKPDLRWVGVVLGAAYLLLAVASALDAWSRSRHRPQGRR